VLAALDFTSALYLGLRHPTGSVRPWAQFTTGTPAALWEPADARIVARELGALQSCEYATLGPSTLHLFWDLFGALPKGGIVIYVDAGVYSIAKWGVDRAAARGASVQSFAHHDPDALGRLLKRGALGGRRPVVVADGFCPACGQPAPINLYLECIRAHEGILVLDDTQALGILGHSPEPNAPYGLGGGGSLRWSHVNGSDVLLISSLAKGFGVPVAVLSGGGDVVRWFEEKSDTRVHCSPPSIAVIHAAERALTVNEKRGDSLRLRLAHLVRFFRHRLIESGFRAIGGFFPVQTLESVPGLSAATLHERLLRLGVRTVLLNGHGGSGPRLTFVLTARHSPIELDYSVRALALAAKGNVEEGVRDPVFQDTRRRLVCSQQRSYPKSVI
jgi:8-amino-7-oxononanoate synthase